MFPHDRQDTVAAGRDDTDLLHLLLALLRIRRGQFVATQ